VHEGHELKEDWEEGREEISDAGQAFEARVGNDVQGGFRDVAETEGEYKAYEEEAYERTYDDDDDDDY
jgi:hypothetical protein